MYFKKSKLANIFVKQKTIHILFHYKKTQNTLKDEERTPTNTKLVKLTTERDKAFHPTRSPVKRNGNT